MIFVVLVIVPFWIFIVPLALYFLLPAMLGGWDPLEYALLNAAICMIGLIVTARAYRHSIFYGE